MPRRSLFATVALALLLVTVLVASAAAQVTREWVVRYDEENLDLRGAAGQVLVDRQGDVYILGDYAEGDLLVAKYNPSGIMLWDRRFPNKSVRSWQPSRTGVIDSLDRLIVAGPGGYVMALDRDGSVVWETSAAEALQCSVNFAAAAIDAAGGIYAAGSANAGGAGPDALVVKYSADGSLLWSRRYDGAGGDDGLWVLRLGADGRVFAGGSSANGILILRYDAFGNDALQITDSTLQLGGTSDIDVDSGGNVLATGGSLSVGGHFYVAKFDPYGQRVWSVADGGGGYTRAIRVDLEGSVYVAGAINPDGTFFRYLLNKYSSGGAPQWSRTYYQYGDSEVFALELDRGIEPVITGEFGFCYDSIRTMKHGGDGAIRWEDSFSTNYCGSVDYGLSLAIDARRNVYVAGYTYDPKKGGQYPYKPTLIKYSQAQTVSIDIKPGQTPNPIKIGIGGTVPVAILSSADFDATRVDPLSVALASAKVAVRGNGSSAASLEDVNGDGRLDIVVHVDTEALQLTVGDVSAVLTGRTLDGTAFEGSDSVRIVQ